MKWATSKDYINLVAKEDGWGAVPTGTRKSTYATPEFHEGRQASPRPRRRPSTPPTSSDSTLPKSPYVGVQYAAIPEFQAIGVAVGQQMSAALSGKVTVDQALEDLADGRRARDEEGRRTTGEPLPRREPGARKAGPHGGARIPHEGAPRDRLPAARSDGTGRVRALVLWMIVPLVMTLYFSFVNYNLMQPGERIRSAGIENFHYFITDPDFWPAVWNTLVLIGSVILITVVLGVRPGAAGERALSGPRHRAGAADLALLRHAHGQRAAVEAHDDEPDLRRAGRPVAVLRRRSRWTGSPTCRCSP